MLRASPRPGWPRRRFERVCADAYRLPLASRSVELIYSNLMLQWCDRPDLVFRELARVLKPGGVFVFSSFGPDTLHELRLAWESVDHGVHVSQFPDMPQLGAALMNAGLLEPVMDVERHQLQYQSVHALMRELQRIGARNAAKHILAKAATEGCDAIVMGADPDRNRVTGNMMWTQEPQRVRRRA